MDGTTKHLQETASFHNGDMQAHVHQPLAISARKRVSGFTLIELVIAVAVVAILAAIAIPSYLDSVRKSRRSEAATALMQVQQAQERWRASNPSYSDDLADLGLSDSTPADRYAISIAAATEEQSDAALDMGAAYVAMAYAESDSSQANDATCRRMAVRLVNGNLTYAGCGSCEAFAFSDFKTNHACWAQ